SQTAQISEVSAQLGLLETQVASLQAAVEALSQPAPELQSPAYEGLTSLRDSTESWFKWSLSIGVLALLGVLGIISAQVFQRINLSEKTKRELKSYLDSYLQQGYLFDQLKEHLVSSGWDPKIIDAVAKELKVKQ
ncbi:MAG TPA: hypothetical protein VJJ82_03070, partial [Candidatus Nanoarchaeia archaeon]|nr:hypothetical protein [Candidatus Nanoarchaeia archaeon]